MMPNFNCFDHSFPPIDLDSGSGSAAAVVPRLTAGCVRIVVLSWREVSTEYRVGAMGCLPHLRFFLIQLPTRRWRGECGQRAKGGEKPGNGQVVNSVEFLLPCDPEKFGAAGPDWQLKARSLRAASNARMAASEERDTRPVAKVSGGWWFLVSWPPDPVAATNQRKFH
jgi:hypothetical protein